jgi:hypothetical protein
MFPTGIKYIETMSCYRIVSSRKAYNVNKRIDKRIEKKTLPDDKIVHGCLLFDPIDS